VLLFDALDREIRAEDADHSLDDVTRLLMAERRVTLSDLRRAVKAVTGEASPLLEDLE
jgi:hypothetical protein